MHERRRRAETGATTLVIASEPRADNSFQRSYSVGFLAVGGLRGRQALRSLPMVYDEDLANRIRELMGGESGVSEQPMFGALAFLVEGNMAIAASGQGGVLVRVDPADFDRLVASTKADVAVMGGRSMRGWLQVAPEHLRTKRQLATWVQLGVGYARSLPVKGRGRSRR